jgi:hypothetical protein
VSAGTVLLRVAAAALCLLALLGSGVPGLLVAAGFVALTGGTTALLRGRSRMLRISGRRAGFGVLAAGLTTLLISGSAVGAPHPAASAARAIASAPGTRTTQHATPEVPAVAVATARATPTPSGTARAAARPALAGTALALLATLPVKGKAALTGYVRTADFGTAWLDVDRNGCDTRDDVLRRDLSATTGSGCRVLTGTLRDPYTGRTIPFVRGIRTSTAVQIDHVVALANAWRTGAQRLSEARRIDLANDPVNLFAVDGPTNEAKSDGDAATWLPPVKAFRCTYIAHQVAVKAAYGLWVAPAEHDAMQRVLRTCPALRAPVSSTAHLVPPGATMRSVPIAAHARTAAPAKHRYANCAAVRAAGAAPLHRGAPGYRAALDRDGDGVACETGSSPSPASASKAAHPAAGSSSAPAGATALCRDGTYSYSQHRSGTCSRHGGVSSWL